MLCFHVLDALVQCIGFRIDMRDVWANACNNDALLHSHATMMHCCMHSSSRDALLHAFVLTSLMSILSLSRFLAPSLSFPPPPAYDRTGKKGGRLIGTNCTTPTTSPLRSFFKFTRSRARQRVHVGAFACPCVGQHVRVCTWADEMWPCGQGPCSWPLIVHAPASLNPKPC